MMFVYICIVVLDHHMVKDTST